MSEKYAYENLLDEYNLSVNELPEDARLGIKSIKQIANAKKMTEARGQNVSQTVLNKIKANDKWVSREIIDFVNDRETNTDDLPAPADETIILIKEETTELTTDQKIGLKIENELEFLHEQFGEENLTIEQIRPAKTTYKTIFDNYETGGNNGVSTSKFNLIEADNEIFTLQKN